MRAEERVGRERGWFRQASQRLVESAERMNLGEELRMEISKSWVE
jgi:hypothetical protein